MAIQAPFLLCLLALAGLLASSQGATPSHHYAPFKRSSFPPGFIFGAGSAAYQSEGAASLEGRGPSIWDVFSKKHPEKISDQKKGDVADDLYHRYKEDVKLIKKVGLDSFRFSISWSRILPKGKISGGVNPLGVKYYNNFINELIAEGITPFVTLFHLDLPQALEEEYGGFLSPKIVKDYVDYVDFCFKTFGDRVKHWVTMNEPNGLCINGYNGGSFAPGRCSKHEGNCTAGNSATEPYIVAHNLLLSHASAVKLYKDKYQAHQKGIIGFTIVTHWFIPRTPSASSQSAASRTLDFMFNWFVNPVIYGEYPQSMRAIVGNRLPKFTAAESKLLKGSLDFLGINYYTTYYAESAAPSNGVNLSYVGDRQSTLTSFNIRGAPIGTPTALSWLYIYPKGFRDLLLYIKEKYNNPIVYVNENGMADANNSTLSVAEAINDSVRIRYLHGHLSYLLQAIKERANVKAYYAWSFFDDFEWDAGYTARFGLIYVDYKNNLKRRLKYSAYWFKWFLLK